MGSRRLAAPTLIALFGLLMAGCHQPGPVTRLGLSSVLPLAARAKLGATAALSVTLHEMRPAGRQLAYLQPQDWDRVQADLTNADPSISPVSLTIRAAVDPVTRLRTASFVFPDLRPAGGYTLTIQALRRNASGGDDVINRGTQANFTVALGANAASVTLTAQGQLQIAPPSASLPGKVLSTFVGNPSDAVSDGPAAAADFLTVSGVARDAAGAFYVADRHAVRKVDALGQVSTLAGSFAPGYRDGVGSAARFNTVYAIAVDATGNAFVIDQANNCVRKIAPSGAVTTVAGGDGTNAYGGGLVDGPVAAARFGTMQGIAVGTDGTVYVSDGGNCRIRAISPAGIVSTLAGNGYGYRDGPGAGALFNNPRGLAMDAAGNVLVTDCGNYCIRTVAPDGTVGTLAGGNGTSINGGGYNDGPASSQWTWMYLPSAVAVDAGGRIYVADAGNHCVRTFAPGGAVSTLAGGNGSTANPSGYQDGAALGARFANMTSLVIDGSGNVIVADDGNHCLRSLTPGGVVSRIAGNRGDLYRDGTGTAALLNPYLMAFDGAGNLLVADGANDCIRRVSPAGVATTLAGGDGLVANGAGYQDGPAATARFREPHGVAVDAAGTVYVADSLNNCIRTMSAGGTVSTLAGGNGTTANAPGSQDGPGASASFNWPHGIAVDAGGNVYVADTSNFCVRRITPAGVVSTLAGGNGVSLNGQGYQDGPGATAKFTSLYGLALDSGGNVDVADDNGTIRQITPAGVVSTLAGGDGITANSFGNQDGPGISAHFYSPRGIAVDASGNLYVSDFNSYSIRQITPSGVVSTLLGSNAGLALQTPPYGIAVNAQGGLCVSENYANNLIRRFQ